MSTQEINITRKSVTRDLQWVATDDTMRIVSFHRDADVAQRVAHQHGGSFLSKPVLPHGSMTLRVGQRVQDFLGQALPL